MTAHNPGPYGSSQHYDHQGAPYPQEEYGAPGQAHHFGGHGQVSAQDRSMALIAHLSTIASMVLSAGWLSFVGPLIVWAMYKDRSPFVRQSAAGAFNFNLSMWVLSIISWIMIFTFVLLPVGVILLILSGLCQLIFHIIGALRAKDGELYRYPMQFVRILS